MNEPASAAAEEAESSLTIVLAQRLMQQARIRTDLLPRVVGEELLIRVLRFLAYQKGPVFTSEAWEALQNLTALAPRIFDQLMQVAAADEQWEILRTKQRVAAGMRRLRTLRRASDLPGIPWSESVAEGLNEAAAPFIFFLAYWLRLPPEVLVQNRFL